MQDENGTAIDVRRRRWRGGWRTLFWGAAAALWCTPLVAMRFTNEVAWSAGDFALFGGMLLVAGGLIESAVRWHGDPAYRAAAALAVITAFLLVWVNGAVGIIGSERDPANLLFVGVLCVGVVGATTGRFRPQPMARTLMATALAQILVGALALAAGWGVARITLQATAFFAVLWLAAASLFQVSGRSPRDAGA